MQHQRDVHERTDRLDHIPVEPGGPLLLCVDTADRDGEGVRPGVFDERSGLTGISADPRRMRPALAPDGAQFRLEQDAFAFCPQHGFARGGDVVAEVQV